MWLNFAKSGALIKVIKQRYSPARYVVPIDTLDTIAEEYYLKRIDLIKIDVEGAELLC